MNLLWPLSQPSAMPIVPPLKLSTTLQTPHRHGLYYDHNQERAGVSLMIKCSPRPLQLNNYYNILKRAPKGSILTECMDRVHQMGHDSPWCLTHTNAKPLQIHYHSICESWPVWDLCNHEASWHAQTIHFSRFASHNGQESYHGQLPMNRSKLGQLQKTQEESLTTH